MQGPSADADRNSWTGGIWASLSEGVPQAPQWSSGHWLSEQEGTWVSQMHTLCTEPRWGSQSCGLESRAALTKNWTEQLSQLVWCPQGGLRGAAAVVFMHQHTEMLGKGWDSSIPPLPANRWVIRRRPEPDAALPLRPAPEGMGWLCRRHFRSRKGISCQKKNQGFLEGGVTGFILRQPLSGLSECCPWGDLLWPEPCLRTFQEIRLVRACWWLFCWCVFPGPVFCVLQYNDTDVSPM